MVSMYFMFNPGKRFILMPQTLKKLRRHIGMGLSVRPRPSVPHACTRLRTVRDRNLKFGMCDEYEN